MLTQIYFKLNYIRTLLICSKMAYSCCFSLGGNLDFLDFLQKKFYNIDYRGQLKPQTDKILNNLMDNYN